ncbi:hypothetical protein McanCB56680_007300 [Microsporum canis]|uniref:Nuclear pore complex component n=1 Tax=Arthroderma otae (strain ATCC MYA-4605 / CBS 113480) TaxID=554155 RepID=C5FHZ3_ARTOC|nr:conserved hypothetical protein [Microsporum canis CBS 113480]EEQ28973.1 conserved hypothetical protein [Microsporum canis CBS 113480]
MAPSSLPSTPRMLDVHGPSTASPGKWRHPHLKEIIRRQNASSVNERTIRRVLWNAGTLIFTGFIGNTYKQYSLAIGSFLQIPTYPDIVLLVVRLLLFINIAMTLYPIYRAPDQVSDIPLTPSQRALLGLDPNSTPPATPGAEYITPPRYRVSSSSRRRSSGSWGSSPFSATEDSPSRNHPDSPPFSPSGSPLFQKGFRSGGRERGRRNSFGSPSPLGRTSIGARDGSSLRAPSSPTPFGKVSSPVMTQKWLFERSLMSSSNGSVFSQ